MCCGNSSTNITKHYFGPHKNEPKVQEILNFPLRSEKRKLELLRLRNAGDYKHNVQVLESGEGTLVTWARKSSDDDVSADNYLPCEDCLAFFYKHNLWRHRQVCPFKKNRSKFSKVQSEASLLLPVSVEASNSLRQNVIGRMNGDEITIAARNDPIIIKIGEKMNQKHRHLPHLYSHVRQKMRELGRFLIAARTQDADVKSLLDVLDHDKYPTAVTATKMLCGYSEEANTCANPSFALKIGHLLKKCAKVAKSESLIFGDPEKGKKSDEFMTLLEHEWTDDVSSSALPTLTHNKMNNGQLLPFTEDLVKLQSYFKEESALLAVTLQSSFSKAAWESLNQITLAWVVLFNRRRGGETERITVEGYKAKRDKQDTIQEIEESLNPTEKMLCSTFSRVEIRGKKGRTVPVLLTPAVQLSIEILLKWRNEAGVHINNPYVFARPHFGSVYPVRSSDVLRRFAHKLDLAKPECVTSTKLRIHEATISQILNLGENDLDIMAGFLGHDIQVHRSFYRLPQETLQIARMGRLLTAFENGTIGQFSGKSIDDISLDGELSSDDDAEGIDDDEHGLADDPGIAVTKTTKSGTIRLTSAQTQTLRSCFETNVALRRELRRHECLLAMEKHPEWARVDANKKHSS